MTHTKTQRGRQCTEPLEDTRQLRSNTSQATAPVGGHPAVSGNWENCRRCTRGRRGNAALTLVRHVPGCAEAATERAARADDQSADRGKPGSRRGAHHHRNRHQAGTTCATVACAHAARRGGALHHERAPAVGDNRRRRQGFGQGTHALRGLDGWLGPLWGGGFPVASGRRPAPEATVEKDL